MAGALVRPGGLVELGDGTRLRAVEIVPAHLPYELSELDKRILHHIIAFAGAHNLYRSIREGLPPSEAELVPDIRAIDYSRVPEIKIPRDLKVIQAYVEDNTPGLHVSAQKISDLLSMLGIRRPRRRPRPKRTATI